MKNNIKRWLTMVLMVLMFGCGILKTGRAPAVIEESAVEEVEKTAIEEEHVEHSSAFNADDLYKSASKIKNARRKWRLAKIKEEVKEEIDEDANEDTKETSESLIEIIQVVDENGNIVASKEIK